MTIVIDANILIVFALSDEALHGIANQKLTEWTQNSESLVAPRLFRFEITAVMRKAVFQQRITHETGRKLLNQLLLYPVTFYEDIALLQEAYEIAQQFNRPRAYDAQYLALARRLSCEFWTADERLFNAVQNNFANIRWLGQP